MKYTESHEWVDVKDQKGRVGITAHAQKELGEIVYIDFPKIGTEIKLGGEIAVLESTKAAVDIYSPITGKITAINEKLKENVSLINSDPEGEGWLFELTVTKSAELELLLEHTTYRALTENQ